MSKFSTDTVKNLPDPFPWRGPKGDSGAVGQKGCGKPDSKIKPFGDMKGYCLSYSGIVFKAWIKEDTFSIIEDATNVTGDELELIKVINQNDWESIREAWAEAWKKQKAYRAFELGDFGDE